MNVGEEIRDYVTIIQSQLEQSKKEMNYGLTSLVRSMKDFIETYDKFQSVSRKIDNLKNKFDLEEEDAESEE